MNKPKNMMSFWPLTIVIAVILCSTCVVGAALDHLDYNAPTWRGDAGSTVQSWSFDDDTNPTAPDSYVNPNGVASLGVNGSFPGLSWKADDLGHSGVWKFEDEMIIHLPNYPDPNPSKEIWLQMTFYADNDIPPDVAVSLTNPPLGSPPFLIASDLVPVDDNYWNATFKFTMRPNPPEEWIWIIPRDCTIFIDELVIDTICVPEPMTISLLGIGGMTLLRKRRK